MDATGQITESFQSKIVLKRIRNFTVFHCDSALLSPSAEFEPVGTAVSNHISNGRQLILSQKILNLCMKTASFTDGVDAAVYVWFMCQAYVHKTRHIPLHPLPA